MRREKGLCENVCATSFRIEKKEKPYKSPASEVLHYQPDETLPGL